MKTFVVALKTFFNAFNPAVQHWAGQAAGQDVEPPYIIWIVMDNSRDARIQSYEDPQGGHRMHVRVHCWGTSESEAWDLHDQVVQAFDTIPIAPAGFVPLHKPRLESALPMPDDISRHHQVASRWYLRWDAA